MSVVILCILDFMVRMWLRFRVYDYEDSLELGLIVLKNRNEERVFKTTLPDIFYVQNDLKISIFVDFTGKRRVLVCLLPKNLRIILLGNYGSLCGGPSTPPTWRRLD